MNHTAARRYAVGSGLTALATASVLAAVAGTGPALGWALAGWSITALAGVLGGAWTAARVGDPGSAVVVAFGATMLARLFVSAAGAAAAAAVGEAAFWPYVGGLVAGFLPLQVFEVGWFYREGRRSS